MKNKIRRLSKGSLSVVLSIMMVISTMLIGSFTVNAAVSQWYVVGYQDGNSNLSWNMYDTVNFSGSTGSCTVTTNGNTNPIYFKLVAIENNNKIVLSPTGSSNVTLQNGVESDALDWNANSKFWNWSDFMSADNSGGNDVDLIYTPDSTATTVTFTVSSDGTYNYVTVSDNRSGSTDPSDTDYYIGGRFKTSTTNTYSGTYAWDPDSENIPFVATDTTGIYKVDTGLTVKDLSTPYNSYEHLFLIRKETGSTSTYYGDNTYTGQYHSFQDHDSSDKAIDLSTIDVNDSRDGRLIEFSDTASTSTEPVTIWLDTNNGMKLYYTVAGTSHSISTADLAGTNITSLSYSVDGKPDVNTARTGEQVTVTATPAENYVLDTVTATYDGGAVSGDVVGNTATFTMPDADVTVSATARQAQTFTVTTAVNDPTMGSVAIDGVTGNTTTVTEGESVTLTATANSGYEFENWTADDTYAGDVDITSPSITVYPTSNVTFTANFAEEKGEETGTYLIVSNTGNNPDNWNSESTSFVVPVYKSSDNTYYVEFNRDDHQEVLDTTGNLYAALKSSNTLDGNIFNGNSSDNYDNLSTSLISAGMENAYQKIFLRFSLNSSVETVRIEFNTIDQNQTRTYTISATETPVDPTDVNVYAKNGTVCSYGTGTSKYGVTTITNDDIVSDSDNGTYKVYTAKEGDTLEIQTVVNSSYYSAGYYVAAFQANGQTLEAEYQGQGIYTAEYLIPDDFEENLEITPVYYNRNIEEAGNYVTLYVDPSQLPEDERGVKLWTNQIACYPYYYTGKTVNNNPEAVVIDGDYPGQPMLKAANGKWYTKVSKYYYDESGKKGSYKVSGITLNNYTNDSVHGSLVPDGYNVNRQTYDFDDFVKIAEANYDIVEFRIEYRGGSYASNQQLLINTATDYPDPSGSIKFDQYDSKGWVALKDYKDNYVSLTYDILDKEQAESDLASDNFLRVISVGNQNVSNHGVWSTVWYVFDQSGKFITKGVPSDFLPTPDGEFEEGSNAKAVHEALANYKSIPVRICYEKEMNAATSADSRNSGVRIDGQWYFGTTSDPIDANVIVEVPGSKDGTWVTDTSGSNKATIDGQTSVHYKDREHIGSLVAQAGSGYMFAGWGYLNDNGEFVSFDNSTKLNTSVSVPLNQNYTFVARFVPVTDGTLVVSHSKYTGSGAYGGAAYYYVSAVAHNADGTTTTYQRVENSSLSIKVNPKDVNKIDFTVTVIPKGDNSYVGTYRRVAGQDQYEQICEKDDFVPGSDEFVLNGKEYSIKFTTTVSDLYDERGQQSVNTFAFYSDVAPVTTTATLNYKYENRFGVINNYTKVVDLTDEYIDKYGKKITDELVYQNAPAIDDLHKDCTWKIEDTKYTVNGMVATLTATQNEKTYHGRIDVTGGGEWQAFDKIKYNEFLYNGDDYYRCEDPNFQYWSVKEYGTDKEVARFYHPWFALRILDNYDIVAICNEDEAKNNAFIDSPVYTREQITDDDGGNPRDYLYADFLVAYMGKENVQLNTDEGAQYKTGIMIELSQGAVLTEENINSETNTATFDNITFESNYEQLEKFATGSDTVNKYTYIGSDTSDNRVVYNYGIDNSLYTNMNRTQFYVRYKNTVANQKYVMKAYYYVYKVDDEGNVTDFTISDEVYFNLYNIGNSAADTDVTVG